MLLSKTAVIEVTEKWRDGSVTCQQSMQWSEDYGTFVPTYFRSLERKYHRWNFRSLVLSLPGTFVPWNFRSLELSLPGTFVPRNFRPCTNTRIVYKYENRITVSLSTKECSSLPTNVALQSVLTYRHVRRTYDAGWHGNTISAKITKS